MRMISSSNFVCGCVFVCIMCVRIVLTVCHCGDLWTRDVAADSGPPPDACKRSADATSGQDNSRAAPTLPQAL